MRPATRVGNHERIRELNELRASAQVLFTDLMDARVYGAADLMIEVAREITTALREVELSTIR